MISLDSGDKIRGYASADAVVDFVISGLDANAIKQLADGQLANAIGDLYTADSADVVTSIILVNTDNLARTVHLYVTPFEGVARNIIPKDMTLGIGYCLITDGNRINVYDASGNLQQTVTIVAHSLGGSSHNADTLSNLNSKVSDATLDDSSDTRAPSNHASNHTDGTDDIQSSSTSQKGIVELAIGSEVNTGTSTTLAVTPDALDDWTGSAQITTLGTISTVGAIAMGGNAVTGHAQAITDNAVVTVDGSPNDGEYTVWGANGIDGKTLAEFMTLLFASALPENVAFILDPLLSDDGKYSGIVEAGTAGAVLAFGDIVQQASDSEWELADATNAAGGSGRLGMCVLAQESGAGNPTTVLTYGKIQAATLPGLTVGGKVYLKTTAGDVDISAPTGTTNFVVRIVGYGGTADDLFFCPDNTYVELA